MYLIEHFRTTRFFYKQRFFQLSLSVAYEKSHISLKCCLDVAYFLTKISIKVAILINLNQFQ